MAMLNVDPQKQSDPFYRYKMPCVQIKVESKGNGIKTVVVNIPTISGILKRETNYPMTFFAHELAVASRFKDEKWILMGDITQEKIQQTLFHFIEKFVLCKACRNPETMLQVDDKKNVSLSCAACSRITPVDSKEKLCNLILKSEKPISSEKSKKADKKKKSKDEEEEERIHKETRAARETDEIEIAVAAAAKRPKEEELPNPVLVFREFLAQVPLTDVEIRGKVWDLKADYGLDDKSLVYLLFDSFFDENIASQIKDRAKILRSFLKPETEKEVISSLIMLCVEKVQLQSKFPIILKRFFDSDVLSDESIIAWHQAKNKKVSKNKDLVAALKLASNPLIEWLQQEEEEESDEEDEESEEEKKVVIKGTTTIAKPPVVVDSKEKEEEEEVDVDDI